MAGKSARRTTWSGRIVNSRPQMVTSRVRPLMVAAATRATRPPKTTRSDQEVMTTARTSPPPSSIAFSLDSPRSSLRRRFRRAIGSTLAGHEGQEPGARLGIVRERRRIGPGFAAGAPRPDLGDGDLARGEADARMARDPLRELRRARLEGAVGHDLVHEPHRPRFLGGDHAAGEEQVPRVSAAHDVEEA